MNAKPYLVRSIFCVILLAVLASACATAQAGTAQAPTAAAPKAPAIATAQAPTTIASQRAATATAQGKLLGQASEIVGVWETFSPHCTPGYMLIRPDGTYTWSCNRDGSDGLSGTYRFDGTDFVILNDICGAEGHYRVYGEGDGAAGKALVFKVVNDGCDADLNTLTAQTVTWVSALP